MATIGQWWDKIYHLASSLSPWVVVAIAIAIANFKVLPFAWHTRILSGYLKHFYFDQRSIPPSSLTSLTVFQPSIYTSRAQMGELDYNLHKSNATYLTDLDIARGYHVYCLFRVGFKKFSTGAERQKGVFFPALGGVTLTFKREIKPYQKYDIWTRVLSWDSKWVYLVSHFVKAGSVKPTTFMDHPWRNKTPSTTRSQEQSSASAPAATTPQVIIYTTCISKYAMKQGRKTIPPVEFLQACGLLPKITDEISVSDPSDVGVGEGSTSRLGKQLSAHRTTPNPESGLLDTIEKRRREGLGVAEHVAGLDQSFDWFRGDEDTVFAYY